MTAPWNQAVAPARAIFLGGAFVALFGILDLPGATNLQRRHATHA